MRPLFAKGAHLMDIESACLACTGDSALPFIVGGVVAVAMVVLVVAFVLMRRK